MNIRDVVAMFPFYVVVMSNLTIAKVLSPSAYIATTRELYCRCG